jgi:hypothetical protein
VRGCPETFPNSLENFSKQGVSFKVSINAPARLLNMIYGINDDLLYAFTFCINAGLQALFPFDRDVSRAVGDFEQVIFPCCCWGSPFFPLTDCPGNSSFPVGGAALNTTTIKSLNVSF